MPRNYDALTQAKIEAILAAAEAAGIADDLATGKLVSPDLVHEARASDASAKAGLTYQKAKTSERQAKGFEA